MPPISSPAASARCCTGDSPFRAGGVIACFLRLRRARAPPLRAAPALAALTVGQPPRPLPAAEPGGALRGGTTAAPRRRCRRCCRGCVRRRRRRRGAGVVCGAHPVCGTAPGAVCGAAPGVVAEGAAVAAGVVAGRAARGRCGTTGGGGGAVRSSGAAWGGGSRLQLRADVEDLARSGLDLGRRRARRCLREQLRILQQRHEPTGVGRFAAQRQFALRRPCRARCAARVA